MLKPYSRAELSFQLGNSIGDEGKNSDVFIAHDPQLDAQIVIKKIPKSSFSAPEEYFQESSILHLSGHPNVVPIHYACEDTDFIYLAMPYYSNGSLNQLINERFLTVREIVRFSSQFLSGIHNIHSKKLIHFDIKPDNILISGQGEAQVSDFGIARPVEANGLAGQDRGYFKVVPPESFNAFEFAVTYDIYQAGLTLYRMCMGNKEFYRQFDVYGDVNNFDRATFKSDVKNGRFPNRAVFLEHIPQALINVIKTSLSPNPNDRYAAAIHMINALAGIDNELLDWQYTEENDGVRKWEKVSDARTVRLIVTPEGGSTAQKTLISGNTQNIREFCVESITRAKIKAFLRKY